MSNSKAVEINITEDGQKYQKIKFIFGKEKEKKDIIQEILNSLKERFTLTEAKIDKLNEYLEENLSSLNDREEDVITRLYYNRKKSISKKPPTLTDITHSVHYTNQTSTPNQASNKTFLEKLYNDSKVRKRKHINSLLCKRYNIEEKKFGKLLTLINNSKIPEENCPKDNYKVNNTNGSKTEKLKYKIPSDEKKSYYHKFLKAQKNNELLNKQRNKKNAKKLIKLDSKKEDSKEEENICCLTQPELTPQNKKINFQFHSMLTETKKKRDFGTNIERLVNSKRESIEQKCVESLRKTLSINKK